MVLIPSLGRFLFIGNGPGGTGVSPGHEKPPALRRVGERSEAGRLGALRNYENEAGAEHGPQSTPRAGEFRNRYRHEGVAGWFRSQGFQHVVLGGHSAGAGETEYEAGMYGGVDAIMVLGWHHRPSNQIGQDFFTGDNPRALQSDYEYFLGTPQHRAEMFYTATADEAVVDADTKAAALTPSGEILSIGIQPSRFVVGNIKVPVFLQLADGDRLFEPQYAEMHKGEFRSAPSVTLDMVTDAGHTFMLTKNGRIGVDHMVDWLRNQPAIPSCR